MHENRRFLVFAALISEFLSYVGRASISPDLSITRLIVNKLDINWDWDLVN